MMLALFDMEGPGGNPWAEVIGIQKWGSYWSMINLYRLVECWYSYTSPTTRTAGLMTICF